MRLCARCRTHPATSNRYCKECDAARKRLSRYKLAGRAVAFETLGGKCQFCGRTVELVLDTGGPRPPGYTGDWDGVEGPLDFAVLYQWIVDNPMIARSEFVIHCAKRDSETNRCPAP